ncbi:MAG: hypothetical protein V2I33_03405 [Kangiellaceae bacterium]|jgi:hypothetical protein|nr:hypothetical protein [Kangiellaceae bacterium]
MLSQREFMATQQEFMHHRDRSMAQTFIKGYREGARDALMKQNRVKAKAKLSSNQSTFFEAYTKGFVFTSASLNRAI